MACAVTEIPGGDPPICDTCNNPIVGPVIRVGMERFCKPCKEKTVMPWPKPTIEDFRLKTEGTDACWIEGCEESQRQRGLCKKHYDRARNNGFLTEVVAQIDARSEAHPSPEAELRALKEALTEAIGPDLPPLEQISRLVAQYAAQLSRNRELEKAIQDAQQEARKQIAAAPSGEVLLSEANLRERYARLNEIGHTESLLTGLSEPLQKALRAVLEEQKFQVLRVCP